MRATAEEIKKRFIWRFIGYINRPGKEELLEYMEENGFFEAPASTKYHGVYAGGLAMHSLNVLDRICQIANQESRIYCEATNDDRTMETLVIVALLHDLCKMDAYKKSEEPNGKYEATKNFPAGHGEKSVFTILRFMKLTEEEILAIRWHMGKYDYAAQGGSYDLDNAFKQCKLAVMLHLADMMATHFDESED